MCKYVSDLELHISYNSYVNSYIFRAYSAQGMFEKPFIF